MRGRITNVQRACACTHVLCVWAWLSRSLLCVCVHARRGVWCRVPEVVAGGEVVKDEVEQIALEMNGQVAFESTRELLRRTHNDTHTHSRQRDEEQCTNSVERVRALCEVRCGRVYMYLPVEGEAVVLVPRREGVECRQAVGAHPVAQQREGGLDVLGAAHLQHTQSLRVHTSTRHLVRRKSARMSRIYSVGSAARAFDV
jgi:hypothetical protein